MATDRAPFEAIVMAQCPQHGFRAITLDDEIGGLRVTPSKCCGRWDTVQQWRLSVDDWFKLAKEARRLGNRRKRREAKQEAK